MPEEQGGSDWFWVISHFLILVAYWVGSSVFVPLDRKTGATGLGRRWFELIRVDFDLCGLPYKEVTGQILSHSVNGLDMDMEGAVAVIGVIVPSSWCLWESNSQSRMNRKGQRNGGNPT